MGVFTRGEHWHSQAQAVPGFWVNAAIYTVRPVGADCLTPLLGTCWGHGHRVSSSSPPKRCASSEPLHPSSTSSHLESRDSKNFLSKEGRTCPSLVQHLTDPAMKHDQGGAWDVLAKHWMSKKDDLKVPTSHHIAWGHNKVSLQF